MTLQHSTNHINDAHELGVSHYKDRTNSVSPSLMNPLDPKIVGNYS